MPALVVQARGEWSQAPSLRVDHLDVCCSAGTEAVRGAARHEGDELWTGGVFVLPACIPHMCKK